jgi:hypothetical protein
MSRVVPFIGLAVIALAISACGGNTGGSHATPISDSKQTTGTMRVAAAVGSTEDEVRDAIQHGQASGLSVRFVRIHTARADHVFSPFSQILRSDSAIIARAYGAMYVWNANDAEVYWSATPTTVNNALPAVHAPNLDRMARRLTGTWAGDLIRLSGSRPRAHADPWAGFKDPWQVAPDYTTVIGPSPEPQRIAQSAKRKTDDWGYWCSMYPVGPNETYIGGCYYYSYYSPWGYGPRTGGGGGVPARPTHPPCTPSHLPASIANAYKADQFAQALTQAVAAANGGQPPTVNEFATAPPNAASNGVADSNNGTRQINWYDDRVNSMAQSAGYSPMQVYSHEVDHLWYRNTPAGGGDYPNPYPGESSFIANPTLTFDDGTSVQFHLLNADGSFNVDEWLGYEHLLIHDDMVQAYGGDTLLGTITDGLMKAWSVTTPDGTYNYANSAAAAQAIAKKLQNQSITNRKAKRPPMTPSTTGGCTSTSSRLRAPDAARSRRNQIEYVGPYTVYWDGVPLSTYPN